MPEIMNCAVGHMAQMGSFVLTDTRLARAALAHHQFVYIFIFQSHFFFCKGQGSGGLHRRYFEVTMFYLLFMH